MEREYYVYLLTNFTNSVIYTGVTNNLLARVQQHRDQTNKASFTSRYKVWKLVHFEATSDVSAAIEREKQIKAGSRKRKVELIEEGNPKWRDLWPEISGAAD